jgi:ABC-2 type transport system permease protein
MAMASMPIAARRRPALYWLVSDNAALVRRSLLHIKHDPDQLVSVTVQPVLLVVMFRYFLGGAIRTGSSESYINFVMAGIFIETAAITATTTAVSVAADVTQGVIDRFRALPMATSAVLVGHVVADLARASAGIVVMVCLGLAVGFRPSASVAGWAAAIGLTLLVTCSLSWVAALLGLLSKSVEAAQQFALVLIIPVLASSAFVPASTMPGWLQAVVANQPMSQAIDAVRALLLGMPTGSHLGLAVVWFAGILTAAFTAAGYLFNRRAGT